MKTHAVSIRGIKTDPLAHELATSEGTRPYLDCLIERYSDDRAGLKTALQVVRDLLLEKSNRHVAVGRFWCDILC